MKLLPDNSIDTCITSPPYWMLRNNGVELQQWEAVTITIFGLPISVPAWEGAYGLEPTVEMYVAHTVLIFREVKRVLKKTGTVWLNLGDTYAGYWGDKYGTKGNNLSNSHRKVNIGQCPPSKDSIKFSESYVKPKDQMGVPWMVYFALRDDGWFARQDIIWNKPNPMPESVTDRCTKSHEYIFLLSKSSKYYFDSEAIKQPLSENTTKDPRMDNEAFTDKRPERDFTQLHSSRGGGMLKPGTVGMANKRSVWTVPTRGYKGAHFATFPPALITDAIRAGSSEHGCCSKCGAPWRRIVKKRLVKTSKASVNSKADHRDDAADPQSRGNNFMKDAKQPGWANASITTGWEPSCRHKHQLLIPAVVMDIFSGTATTAAESAKMGRDYFACEINQKYIKLGDRRLHDELGIFNHIKN